MNTHDRPANLFTECLVSVGSFDVGRYVSRVDDKAVLLYTDGACLNNGQANPKAGWAVVYGLPTTPGFDPLVGYISTPKPRVLKRRLELVGPFGNPHQQTSNRAELRPVIAALSARVWWGAGFDTVVIATDLEYVVKGATEWARAWVRNGWGTSGGHPVKSRDLWEALLGIVENFDEKGASIQMWWIPREDNAVADRAAKLAAEENDMPTFMPYSIVGV